MSLSPARALCALFLAGTFTLPVSADLLRVELPAGLNPGDTFRLIFITDHQVLHPTSSNIADYDAYVTSKANDALSIITAENLLAIFGASGVTWQAVASTSTVDAFDHIGGAFAVPIFSLNGALVASSSTDLWDGTLTNAVRYDDRGHYHNYAAWTGTGADGLKTANPLGSATPTWGYSDYGNVSWIAHGTAPNTQGMSLYGISSVMTYSAVPEPGSLVLAGLGALGLAAVSRRFSRR